MERALSEIFIRKSEEIMMRLCFTRAILMAMVLSLALLTEIQAAEPEGQGAANEAESSPADVSVKSGGQVAGQLDAQVRIVMDYLLHLPQDYENKDSWPLMLFLHGAGERGDDLELVKKHGPPKTVETDSSFPFVLVTPQCKANRWWEPIFLTALLDDISANYKIDKDRIYVTGLSMGGYGTWSLAAHTPKRFAAIVPICGGGDPNWAPALAHLPVWVFHGAKDKVVKLEHSQKMADALKEHGGNVKFTVYPEAEHDSWTQTYDNPELYTWLLEQRRSGG
jgi:predicted peptidase